MSDPLHPHDPTDRILRIATWSTVMAFGAMSSTAYSLRKVPAGFTFDFTFGSAAAFLIGAVVAWIYWRVVATLRDAPEAGSPASKLAKHRSGVGIVSSAVILGAIGLFLHPVKFVPPGKLKDVLIGLGLAFVVLGLVAIVVIKLIRLLEADEKRGEQSHPRDKEWPPAE
ncbi:MAG TPA: hypothetical protein VMS21_03045 [Methylomirabilota bacterium]|nr:hypothetical protein [Methylomirabilota bacterium]